MHEDMLVIYARVGGMRGLVLIVAFLYPLVAERLRKGVPGSASLPPCLPGGMEQEERDAHHKSKESRPNSPFVIHHIDSRVIR